MIENPIYTVDKGGLTIVGMEPFQLTFTKKTLQEILKRIEEAENE